jgi:hypothetical protein
MRDSRNVGTEPQTKKMPILNASWTSVCLPQKSERPI